MWLILCTLNAIYVHGFCDSESFVRMKPCTATNWNPNHVLLSTSVSTRGTCAYTCLETSNCRSFGVSADVSPLLCSLYGATLNETWCPDANKQYYNAIKALDNPCLYGGTHNHTDDTCWCVDGYVGKFCERLMWDCSDGMASGFYVGVTKVFAVQPLGSPHSFKVRCKMIKSGQTIIYERYHGWPDVDFARTWLEYRNGFGILDPGNNFWLGNERLHLLTKNRQLQLVISMNDYKEFAPLYNIRRHMYHDFKVGPESDYYPMNYTSHAPDNASAIDILGDCFLEQVNLRFSTIDSDNDNGPGSCAAIHSTGWWFDKCEGGEFNPTGRIQSKTELYQNSAADFVYLPVPGNWAPEYLIFTLEE